MRINCIGLLTSELGLLGMQMILTSNFKMEVLDNANGGVIFYKIKIPEVSICRFLGYVKRGSKERTFAGMKPLENIKMKLIQRCSEWHLV